MTRTRGFSLIELTVVLVIMSLLTGVASVSVARRMRHARQADVIDATVRLDAEARLYAIDHKQRCVLSWSQYDNELQVVAADDADHIALRCTAPDGWIVSLLRPAGDEEVESVTFGEDGRTPTYAVEFRLPDGSYQRLLFAGVTGEVKRCDEQEDYRRYATLLSGDDAD